MLDADIHKQKLGRTSVVFVLFNELSILFVCFPLKLTESGAFSFVVVFYMSVAFWKLSMNFECCS